MLISVPEAYTSVPIQQRFRKRLRKHQCPSGHWNPALLSLEAFPSAVALIALAHSLERCDGRMPASASILQIASPLDCASRDTCSRTVCLVQPLWRIGCNAAGCHSRMDAAPLCSHPGEGSASRSKLLEQGSKLPLEAFEFCSRGWHEGGISHGGP
jgi:hypothetical protein